MLGLWLRAVPKRKIGHMTKELWTEKADRNAESTFSTSRAIKP